MFRSMKTIHNDLPKASFLQTCFFGENARRYYRVKDFSEIDAINNVLTKSYQDEIKKLFGETDYYRYQSCKLFTPKPTSSGICHTFNGHDLEKILKPTTWTNKFQDSFKADAPNEILKSTGIGLEDGFVFSLDTMQSYFYSLKDRDENQKEINSFLIKVHPAGELPWMMKEQSSWQQISASPEDMITRFITIKGEIIADEVWKWKYSNFINLFVSG